MKKECHSEALDNRALPYRTVARWAAHSSVGEMLVPTCIEQDVQELCASMLRVL